MKNIHLYIIAGMTILIVVLCFFLYSANSSVDIYKEQLELSKLKKNKIEVSKKIDTEIKNISESSKETVIKSNSIIKKITHETPKINDTTGDYMFKYVRNYRPEQD